MIFSGLLPYEVSVHRVTHSIQPIHKVVLIQSGWLIQKGQLDLGEYHNHINLHSVFKEYLRETD